MIKYLINCLRRCEVLLLEVDVTNLNMNNNLNITMTFIFSPTSLPSYFLQKQYPLYVSGVYNTSSVQPTFVLSPRLEDAIDHPELTSFYRDDLQYQQANPSARSPPEIPFEVYFRYEETLNQTMAWTWPSRVVRNMHLGGYERIAGYVENMMEQFGRI
jgi:hypothetical protein